MPEYLTKLRRDVHAIDRLTKKAQPQPVSRGKDLLRVNDKSIAPESKRLRLLRCSEGLGVSGSSGFGWLGILLLRLNFPEVVASQPFIYSGFKALRRPFGTSVTTPCGQGQCPLLNLEDGSDNS